MLPLYPDNPFNLQLSFHRVIEALEALALSESGGRSADAKILLQKVAEHPELIDGLKDETELETNRQLITELLADMFPKALTNNEIKAITIPYQGWLFNESQRFLNILKENFNINLKVIN